VPKRSAATAERDRLCAFLRRDVIKRRMTPSVVGNRLLTTSNSILNDLDNVSRCSSCFVTQRTIPGASDSIDRVAHSCHGSQTGLYPYQGGSVDQEKLLVAGQTPYLSRAGTGRSSGRSDRILCESFCLMRVHARAWWWRSFSGSPLGQCQQQCRGTVTSLAVLHHWDHDLPLHCAVAVTRWFRIRLQPLKGLPPPRWRPAWHIQLYS
jgi:hypothetical protein